MMMSMNTSLSMMKKLSLKLHPRKLRRRLLMRLIRFIGRFLGAEGASMTNKISPSRVSESKFIQLQEKRSKWNLEMVMNTNLS